ncbi:hypothetical protein DNTS_018257, partial [Danionella cerebrum]
SLRRGMAKNKQRGKKIQNVFQIANKQSKPKTKAKPVKSSLKHINTLKNEKVESLNQMFTEVQRDTRSLSKTTLNEDKVAPKVRLYQLFCLV